MSETQFRKKQDLLLIIAASRLDLIDASAGTVNYYQQKFHWLRKPLQLAGKPMTLGLSLLPALLAGLKEGRRWKQHKEEAPRPSHGLRNGLLKQVLTLVVLSVVRSVATKLLRH